MDPITTFVADVEAAAVKYRQAVTPVPPVPPSPPPSPPPLPPIPPVTNDVPKVVTSTRKVGGWKLVADYCGNGMAFNRKTRELAVAGKREEGMILLYDVPTEGAGTDPASLPVLQPKATVPYWWGNVDFGPGVDPTNPAGGALFANGLWYDDTGDLWSSPKEFYAQNPYANLTVIPRAKLGSTYKGLMQQNFSGFIKRFGQEPLFGCGTPDSSKGATIGPTAADVTSRVLLDSPVFDCPAADRPLRDPDYTVEPNQQPQDQWLAYPPTVIDGVRYGYFTGGTRVYGGGLLVNNEYRFWVYMPDGTVSYQYQGTGVGEVFSYSAVTREYRYPAAADGTANRKNYKWFQTDFRGSAMPGDSVGAIRGQDFYDDGRLLLLEGGAWATNTDNYPASKNSPVLWLCEP